MEGATLVMSKEVYDSELQWGRLVIPGKFVSHFRRLQEAMHVKSDYHLWVQQHGENGKGYQIGVKMTIQRPMLIELHPLYRHNKVKPGDTVMIHQRSTGQLTACVAKGQGRTQQPTSATIAAVDAGAELAGHSAGGAGQPRPIRVGSGRRSNASSRSSSLDLGDLDTPTMGSHSAAMAPPAMRSRRTLYSSSQGRWGSEATGSEPEEADEAGEEEAEEEEEACEDGDSQLEAYKTSSGRWATRLVRQGSTAGRTSCQEDGFGWAGSGSAAAGMPRRNSKQLVAIVSQAIGYSDDMEVDEAPQASDMRRFDALVNVAADYLCA